MGGSQSIPDQLLVGGFRMFKVCKSSPAECCGLETFFDFIVEIDGVPLRDASCHTQFFQKVKTSENRRLHLVVFNIRTRCFRDVYIVPTNWGGTGLLGATVRYDMFETAQSQGVRVLDVEPNSPAENAGLMPYRDYILGSSETLFGDMEDLVDLVSNSIGKPLAVSVYNVDLETIREVVLTPNFDWGGDGSLGCGIACGYLHRIPPSRGAAPPGSFYHYPHSSGPRPSALQHSNSPEVPPYGSGGYGQAPPPYGQEGQNFSTAQAGVYKISPFPGNIGAEPVPQNLPNRSHVAPSAAPASAAADSKPMAPAVANGATVKPPVSQQTHETQRRPSAPDAALPGLSGPPRSVGGSYAAPMGLYYGQVQGHTVDAAKTVEPAQRTTTTPASPGVTGDPRPGVVYSSA